MNLLIRALEKIVVEPPMKILLKEDRHLPTKNIFFESYLLHLPQVPNEKGILHEEVLTIFFVQILLSQQEEGSAGNGDKEGGAEGSETGDCGGGDSPGDLMGTVLMDYDLPRLYIRFNIICMLYKEGG